MISRLSSGVRFAGLIPLLTIFASSSLVSAQQSVARQWNDLLLESIRHDLARPTVHARNLYHVSAAMWDAWATYDSTAQTLLFRESHPTTSSKIGAYRAESMSYAVYRILSSRFAASPAAVVMQPKYDQLMSALGYKKSVTTVSGNKPAAIGNRIAAACMDYGRVDQSNEANGFINQHYKPVNKPLVPALPGNPTITDPNRWQPLALKFFVDQSGNVFLGGYPEFLGPEWGVVSNFALSQKDLTVTRRDGFDYWVYHDPGAPPYLNSPTAADYKRGFEMVSVWSSHLDPSDGVMMDASPAAVGNSTLPSGPPQYGMFYDFPKGGDWGKGYTVNPVTGQPYAKQMVPRGDYARVLAEFWADGPDSETPPGHWFTILNYVSDHPLVVKRLGGTGPVLSDLEWDVKCYLALAGAMHDSAVAAWGVKGLYDYLRPVSALRLMADHGQSTDQLAANYHPDGISLHPGFIESVTLATTASGQRHAHLAGNEGKIAVRAWRGPTFIKDPLVDTAGVGWILAENWWPYQRPSFVTPPFAGYVSGHSTFSRAAAVIMDRLTGSPYFPGGLGEFVCKKNQFLVFEEGPSVTVKLQWASYYDASDQCSLSRIWGGIHPPADDIPGRHMGQQIGVDAFALAERYWAGTASVSAQYSTYGVACAGSNGKVTLVSVPSALAVVGSTMEVDVINLPVAASTSVMAIGFVPFAPAKDLSGIGMTGCSLDVDIISTEVFSVSNGLGTWMIGVPNVSSLIGQSLYHQGITLDPGANSLGVTTSNAGHAVIGI